MKPNNALPLCKDCKHKGKPPNNINQCQRPIGTNLYDGTVLASDLYYNNERSTGKFWSFVFDLCGKQGRYFEEDKRLSKLNNQRFLWGRNVVPVNEPKPKCIEKE